MPSHQVHLRYPVPNLIPESSFPLLPSGPFPTAKYQYHTGKTFELHPLTSSALSGQLPVRLSIGAPIELGFGLYRQRVQCSTGAYLNAEARIYDPLYVDITDLPSIEGIPQIPLSLTLLVPQEGPSSKEATSQQHFSLKDDMSTLAESQKYALGDDSSTLHSLSQSLEGVQIAPDKPPMHPPAPIPSTSETLTLQRESEIPPSHESDHLHPGEVAQESSEDLLAGIRRFLDEEGIVSSPHFIPSQSNALDGRRAQMLCETEQGRLRKVDL